MPVTMSVELSHDGHDEAFEADALNVSAGGLGIRSAMLPDVGQRMTCRFAMPELDAPCEAEGEVVWASDAGTDAGEFGIRFDTLEPRIGAALSRWARSLEGEDVPAARAGGGRQVRVQLDGVASPIEAEVSLRTEDVLKVEQPLPFLRIGTGAVVAGAGSAGARRVLRSVELRVEGAVPRLVLELGGADGTMSDTGLDELLGPERAPGVGPARAGAASLDAPSGDADAGLDRPHGAAPTPESLDADADAPAETPDAGAASVSSSVAASSDAPAPRARARRDDEARAVRLEPSGPHEVSVDALVASAGELGDPEEEPSLAERVRALRDAAGPALARALSSLRSGWAVFVATTGPRARVLGAALVDGLRALAAAVRERAPGALVRLFGRAPKRRTTAVPPPSREPTGARRSQVRSEVVPAPRKVPPRAVVAGVLVLAAVALVLRATLSGGASAEDLPVAPTTGAAVEEAGEEPLPAGTPTAPASAVELTASAAAEPAPASAAPVATSGAGSTTEATGASLALPGTMPAPTTEAGRIPAPTFPVVGAGSDPAAAEPRVVDDDGDLTFGAAEVPHGRTTTLRMSLPVTALEGESDSTGFTVTFHGALSLDRAGPIAAANPSVERAAILNRGDHAVLTVRFVAGRTPAFRVAVSGSSATVMIGR